LIALLLIQFLNFSSMFLWKRLDLSGRRNQDLIVPTVQPIPGI
jgi:hypothetical protein